MKSQAYDFRECLGLSFDGSNELKQTIGWGMRQPIRRRSGKRSLNWTGWPREVGRSESADVIYEANFSLTPRENTQGVRTMSRQRRGDAGKAVVSSRHC